MPRDGLSEPGPPQTARRTRAARLFLAAVVLAALAYLFFGPGPAAALAGVRAHLADWQAWAARHRPAALVAFFLGYAVLTSLPLPVLTAMSLLAGALFGRPLGTAVAALGYTAGVTAAFLTARRLFRDRVRRGAGRWLRRVERGVERDGAYYLLALRLMPTLPFFLVNVLVALTPLRTGTFAAVSLIGVLPLTFLCAGMGSELASLESPAGVLSPTVLLSLAALAALPLAARKLFRLLRPGHPHRAPTA
jgi:uncharacterized membrane protein YdjX (TVP38/TMEM64 family)